MLKVVSYIETVSLSPEMRREASTAAGLDGAAVLDSLFDQAVAFIIDKHFALISGVQC